MARNKILSRSNIEQIITVAVLFVLILFSYAHFYKRPYLGFSIFSLNGKIDLIHNYPSEGETLFVGDRVLSVGGIPWNNYTNLDQMLFEGVSPGETLELMVLRGNSTEVINWSIPEITQEEIFTRLVDSWWLSYPFWIAGTVVLMFVRPLDQRRLLLTTFFYLIAVWLAAGTISAWNIYQGSFILYTASWLLIPVSLHLHWTFPQPLGRLPSLWWVLYVFAFICIIAEWFDLIPQIGFIVALIIAASGSLILLILHIYSQPENRKDVILFLTLIGLALLPAMILGGAGYLDRFPWFGGGALLSLIAIPVAYLFTVYRKQFGDLEFRANRVISIYLFIALLVTIYIVFTVFLEPKLEINNTIATLTVIIIVGVISSIATLLLFNPFQRLIDEKVLGINIPPSRIIETYASKISTSLDRDNLFRLLAEEIEPSLLIRESALILLNIPSTNDFTVAYSRGIDDRQLPQNDDLPSLMSSSGTYLPPSYNLSPAWIRLILPLRFENQVIGLWLLGRRDPDDYYANIEIPMYQAITDQTAIALTNIKQTNYLHSLYQANINRQELELNNLALELHDNVLSQLALIAMDPDNNPGENKAGDIYISISSRIREIVNGLRPALLSYGLRVALDELGDNILEQSSESFSVQIEVPPTNIRYDPQTELHIYRILQQACTNAIQHSKGTKIIIRGKMHPDEVDLSVIDDGIGFGEGVDVDIQSLLASKHFGIVGMYERASIIGAALNITSSSTGGVMIRLHWSKIAKNQAKLIEHEIENLSTRI